MMSNSIGDLARAAVLQSASNRLKSSMDVLTQELTSGKVADLGARLQGDLVPIHQIEHRIRQMQQFNQSNEELGNQADAMQGVIGSLSDTNRQMATELRLSPAAPTPGLVRARSENAFTALQTTLSQLNSSAAGVQLFAGTMTDTPPLSDAAELMGQLSLVTAGLSDPTAIETALDAWFDAPAGGGGFLDTAYHGSTGQTRQARISDVETAAFGPDASAPEFRQMIKGLALASLIEKGGLTLDNAAQQTLLSRAGEVLLANQADLVAQGASVGALQHRIEAAKAANGSQLTSYEMARNRMTEADPFATATALNEVQTHLEMLHTLTARLSKLKLVDFLR